MKLITNYIFFTFLLLLLGCNESGHTKKLYAFDKDTLEFRKINKADTFQEKIFCKNYSKSKIKILKVEAGCGCTTALLVDSVINKGDSIPILVKYIPSKSNDIGSILKYISIRTNSTPAFLNLVIKGEVTN